MLTSEELFPPEYCFVGRCSSHLAPFLPPPLHHRHSLLLSLPPRRHCFNETGKCNLFVLPSPRRKRGYPRFFLLSLQYPFPRFSPPEAPARLVSPCHAFLSRRRSVPLSLTNLAENRSRQFSNHFYAAPPPRRFLRLVEWRTSITMGDIRRRDPCRPRYSFSSGVRSKRVKKSKTYTHYPWPTKSIRCLRFDAVVIAQIFVMGRFIRDALL